jgi:aerobic carbon-monoxide dehydrogenase large subunit
VKPEDHTVPCFTQADGKPAFSAPNIPIVRDKVHHIGEIVAFVVADTLQRARDAAELIEVDYEVLPAVVNGLKALESGAPVVWDEQPSNIAFDGLHGDHANAEAAFKRAKYVVEEEFPFNRVANAQMEPRGCLAEYKDDRFILHAGSQGVHRLKGNAAVVFSCDPQKIRVFTRDTGGGFGPRSHLYPEYVLAMWASRKLKRAVKWTSDRSEGFLSDYQARDVTIKAALALDDNGKFLALRETIYSNVGGNCVSYVPAANGSRIATTVYKTPYLQMRAIGILTNTLPSVNYRGAGRPQAMLVMERLVDLAAEKTGIDRIELRRRNLIAPTDFPFKMAGGLTYDCGEFEANMDRCMELIDWKGHAARREDAKRRGKLCGIGLANYIETPVGAPLERSQITIRTDADKVDVIIGTQSGGQGHETSFAQVIESWLGVPMNDVNLITGDSDIVLEGGGTHSDRSIRLGGFVMVKASEQIIEKGTKIAAHLMEAAAGDIEFRKGDGPARFQVKGTDRSISLFEAARAAATDKVPQELRGPLSGDGKFVGRIPAYPNGCAAAEIEIDPDTGVVEIARYVCIDDVGRVVNPLIVDGQTHGGIVQGVGQVLTEHVIHDADGQILTGSFMDYGMPRADMFPEFKVENNEVITKGNPLGVKGGGEAGTTGALAVMMNAILDALKPLGITRFDMPATPDRVWHAIHAARK